MSSDFFEDTTLTLPTLSETFDLSAMENCRRVECIIWGVKGVKITRPGCFAQISD